MKLGYNAVCVNTNFLNGMNPLSRAMIMVYEIAAGYFCGQTPFEDMA